MVVGLAMIPFRPDFVAIHVFSDVGTLLFFLLCLVVASKYTHELTTQRTVYWFCVIYIGIAVFAYYAGVNNLRPGYWYDGRWDPPYYMLFGGLALFIRYGRNPVSRLLSGTALMLMLVLALQSGNRTQFLIGLLVAGLAWASNHTALFMMSVACVGFTFVRSVGLVEFDPFDGLFAESRFSLLAGGVDDSLAGRIDELRDIWYHLTVLNSGEQTLFGRGAGALWHPITRTRVIVDANGDLYYLHVGFAHLTYRFGVLGLLLFLFWMLAALNGARALFTGTHSIGEKFWILGGIGFSLNFFLQNSLYDPPAVLAMAVLLVVVGRSVRRGDGHIAGPVATPESPQATESTARYRPVGDTLDNGEHEQTSGAVAGRSRSHSGVYPGPTRRHT